MGITRLGLYLFSTLALSANGQTTFKTVFKTVDLAFKYPASWTIQEKERGHRTSGERPSYVAGHADLRRESQPVCLGIAS